MRCHVILVLLAMCLGASGVLFAADWPTYLGPNVNNFSSEKLGNKDWNTKAPAILWKVDLADGGYAGPSVADGKVFIIDHQGSDDIVRALNFKDGTEVWRYTYADTNRANYGFARSTPVTDGAKVYTLSRLGIVNCLDIKTGKKIWSRDLMADFGGRRPGWDLSMSPLIDKEKLILMPGGNDAAVVALNKETGATIWKGGGSDTASYATPVLATINNKRQYILFTVNAVMGVDTENGTKLWSYPWKTGCDVNAATPIVIGNSVFITSGYGHGSALIDVTADGAKARWETNAVQSRFITPCYADGYVYTTTEANQLMCVDVQTGKIMWKQPGYEWGGLVGIDGMYIVMDGRSGDAVLAKMAPEGFTEIGRFKPLGGQSWTAPIISNGKLIVRNTKAIACFDLQ